MEINLKVAQVKFRGSNRTYEFYIKPNLDPVIGKRYYITTLDEYLYPGSIEFVGFTPTKTYEGDLRTITGVVEKV